jgi:hypothetical protein
MLGLACLYILAGVVQDILIVRYYLAIAQYRTVVGPALGALITVLTVGVYESLITSRSLPLILAFGLGTGLGTRFGMFRVKK